MLFPKEADKQEGLFRKNEAHLVTESCMQCLPQSKVLSLFIFLSKSRQTRLLVGWTCLSAVIVTTQANVGLETLRDLQLMLVSDMTLLRSLNSLVPDSGPRHFPLSLAHWSLHSSRDWVFILTWGVEEQDPDVVVVVWLWFQRRAYYSLYKTELSPVSNALLLRRRNPTLRYLGTNTKTP